MPTLLNSAATRMNARPTAVRPPVVRREYSPGLDLAIVERRSVVEFHMTLRPLPGERAGRMLWRLDTLLHRHRASVVRHEIFGPLSACAEVSAAFEQLFGKSAWPVMWLEGDTCEGGSVAGMHIFAIAGAAVGSVSLEGRVVGREFNDGHARHCVLGDVRADDVSDDQPRQALQAFENTETALRQAGMNMTQVARTWLFLDDILGWYGPLNTVRAHFFEERKMFDHVVPASTGVGVKNPAGAALSMGAWAAEPTGGSFAVKEVLSPMQCPAPAYGSCFSRAVEMITPGWRRLFISGTASIEPKGASVCANDMDGQIDLTMQVVRAILVSREMEYADVTRATAYLRHPADLPVWRKWRDQLGLEQWPVIATQAVICRDELLFEIELDAMAPIHDGQGDWQV
jgi:enamine deaminase RidA (YjgF/YER057c/UK114 family)